MRNKQKGLREGLKSKIKLSRYFLFAGYSLLLW